MPLTAQNLIEAAYSRSTANDPGKLATDQELLARLTRVYAGLFALIARQRPDEFAADTDFTLAGGDSGFTLAADTVEIHRLQNADGDQVHLIPLAEINRTWHIAPSMYRQGARVRSRLLGGDPLAGDVITAWLLGPAASLTTLPTQIDATFPIRHIDVAINDLALYLDAKDEGRDPAQFNKLGADQSMKLQALAAEYDLEASATEFVHGGSTRVPSKEASK